MIGYWFCASSREKLGEKSPRKRSKLIRRLRSNNFYSDCIFFFFSWNLNNILLGFLFLTWAFSFNNIFFLFRFTLFVFFTLEFSYLICFNFNLKKKQRFVTQLYLFFVFGKKKTSMNKLFFWKTILNKQFGFCQKNFITGAQNQICSFFIKLFYDIPVDKFSNALFYKISINFFLKTKSKSVFF